LLTIATTGKPPKKGSGGGARLGTVQCVLEVPSEDMVAAKGVGGTHAIGIVMATMMIGRGTIADDTIGRKLLTQLTASNPSQHCDEVVQCQ
jgi:hypothetical protein